MDRMYLISIAVLLAGCASIARTHRNERETLDLFVEQLRGLTGQGAVDCGMFTVDGSHANDRWACAGQAHDQRRPFFMGEKLKGKRNCASWTGNASNAQGETFEVSVNCSSAPRVHICDLPFLEGGNRQCSVLDSV